MTDALVEASRQATDLAISLLAITAPGEKTYKTDRDFATAADLLIEREVRMLLEELTPDVPFFGEEYGGSSSTGTYWCLDPIDGTLNYSRGIPIHGISLAYVENGVPQLGEIALPALGERYQMIGGKPTCNGQPISLSKTSALREAVVSVGDFATGKGSEAKNRTRLAAISALADNVQRIRMLGSAATDLAWLAAGRIDAVIMHSNKPWDVAAGIALAGAVGAKITATDGTPYSIASANVVAAAPRVHAALIEFLDANSARTTT